MMQQIAHVEFSQRSHRWQHLFKLVGWIDGRVPAPTHLQSVHVEAAELNPLGIRFPQAAWQYGIELEVHRSV